MQAPHPTTHDLYVTYQRLQGWSGKKLGLLLQEAPEIFASVPIWEFCEFVAQSMDKNHRTQSSPTHLLQSCQLFVCPDVYVHLGEE